MLHYKIQLAEYSSTTSHSFNLSFLTHQAAVSCN